MFAYLFFIRFMLIYYGGIFNQGKECVHERKYQCFGNLWILCVQ